MALLGPPLVAARGGGATLCCSARALGRVDFSSCGA